MAQEMVETREMDSIAIFEDEPAQFIAASR